MILWCILYSTDIETKLWGPKSKSDWRSFLVNFPKRRSSLPLVRSLWIIKFQIHTNPSFISRLLIWVLIILVSRGLFPYLGLTRNVVVSLPLFKTYLHLALFSLPWSGSSPFWSLEAFSCSWCQPKHCRLTWGRGRGRTRAGFVATTTNMRKERFVVFVATGFRHHQRKLRFRWALFRQRSCRSFCIWAATITHRARSFSRLRESLAFSMWGYTYFGIFDFCIFS